MGQYSGTQDRPLTTARRAAAARVEHFQVREIDALDRLLARFYGHGWFRYAACFPAVSLLTALPGLAVGYLAVSSFTGASSTQLVKLAIGTVAASSAGMAGAFLILARDVIAWAKWGSDPDPATAAEMWNATARAPVRLIGVGISTFSLAFIPGAIAADRFLHLPWSSLPALYLAIVVAIFFSGSLNYFVLELLLRPLRRDIAERLPVDFQPRQLVPSLRTRLLAVIFVIGVTTGLLVAAVESHAHGPAARLTSGVVVALVVAASFGLLPASVLAQSELLARRALIRSARKVRTGDLDAAIPLVEADETAGVAKSFNEMLSGLRERELLREERAELIDELRASRARLVASAADTRRKVERDLHDGAQQHLVLLNLRLGVIESALEHDPDARRMVTEARSELGRALAELRDLARGIYPEVLTSDGLAAAVSEAAMRAGIPATVSAGGTGRYSTELEAATYFCCLEALQNAARHGGEGTSARVLLAERDEALAFEIADDGRGFDPAAKRGRGGLQNMADRIGALGGTLEISSAPGDGTTIAASIPIRGGAPLTR